MKFQLFPPGEELISKTFDDPQKVYDFLLTILKAEDAFQMRITTEGAIKATVNIRGTAYIHGRAILPLINVLSEVTEVRGFESLEINTVKQESRPQKKSPVFLAPDEGEMEAYDEGSKQRGS